MTKKKKKREKRIQRWKSIDGDRRQIDIASCQPLRNEKMGI